MRLATGERLPPATAAPTQVSPPEVAEGRAGANRSISNTGKETSHEPRIRNVAGNGTAIDPLRLGGTGARPRCRPGRADQPPRPRVRSGAVLKYGVGHRP